MRFFHEIVRWIVALACAGWVSMTLAQAPAWKPDKNIEIVVGTSAGGGQDTAARLVHKLIQDNQLLTMPSSVVNRPGAGSSLGASYLNLHAGDAHYVMLTTTPLITNYLTGISAISYTDITPLAVMFDEYIVATVVAGSTIKSGRQLLDRLREDPASLSVGIPGAGGGGHLAFALAAKGVGVDARKLRTVVFKSGGDSVSALLGGHIDVMTSTTAAALPHHRAGKARILAVAAAKRISGELADVPTWRELGSDAVLSNWRGMIGPRRLSAAQIAYWENLLARVATGEDFRSELEKKQLVQVFMRSVEMEAMLKSQHESLRTVLTELGMAKR